jgi:hypothetical protein
MGAELPITTGVRAVTLEDLRRELAAVQITIARSGRPRDPDMLRMAEAKLVQLSRDIDLIQRHLAR